MSEPIYRNPAVAILRTREDYIKQVRTHLAKSAENAFEAGKVLLEARAKLDRPQFLEMLQDQDFPVSESTAYRLMEVAGNEVLLSFAHAQKLPTSWYSLYELGKLQAKLPAPRFQKLIEDGTINPKMERKDIARLQPKKRPATPADPKGRTSNTTDTPIRMDAHDRLRHDQNRLVALYLKDAIKYREYREIDAYITQQVQEQAERKQLFGDMRGTEEETPRPPTADLPVVTIPENAPPLAPLDEIPDLPDRRKKSPVADYPKAFRVADDIVPENAPDDVEEDPEMRRQRQRREELSKCRHGI